ncbi:nucleolar protein 11-like [Montipora capricornis]|uniref:nucleolar protein 11-like n=1 Tax=Montipora capricornis TaxID=246305 RepID=UPI0035F174BF
MADLREPFELCKILQNDSLLGISRHTKEDHILVTFSDRGVLVYNLQLQKLINSWSVKQKDNVTIAAVHDRVEGNFVMVVNRSEIFVWKETNSDLKQCQRIQSDKDICSLLVWKTIQTAPCVVFQDGSSMSLAEIASTSKTETGKRRKTTKFPLDLLWSFALQYQNKPFSASVLVVMHAKNKYLVKIAYHGRSGGVDQEKTAIEWALTPPAKDASLLSCCACEEGHGITSYWSDGSLCFTELESILKFALSDSNNRPSPLTCRRIQRLHPLHSGSDKGSVALAAIDPERVCLCGSITIEGKLKDAIMVWDIKYGTLQSWQTLDKMLAKQNTLQSLGQPEGAFCACYIPGFICVGFCHTVAVCQFCTFPCSLASVLGQLDCTANFLQDETLKPELLITPKLARPGRPLNVWKKTMKKKDHLEKKKLQKLTDPSKTSTKEALYSELDSYTKMQMKWQKQGNKDKASHEKESENANVLSQHFVSGVLSRCVYEKRFWAREPISKLLKTKCVPPSCSKELLNCIMEKNDLELLKECFENIKGIPEDTVVDCLRHVLRQEHTSPKENAAKSLQMEVQGGQMPLEKANFKYLCAILCYKVNDVFLLPCLKKLPFEDVMLLLKFFMCLLERGQPGFQDLIDCETLTYPQVLDWAGLVLNAHFSQLVISPEAHKLLVRYHSVVSQQVRTYERLRELEGFLGHFKIKTHLPKADQVGLYTIEELEL